jgi:predicted Zn-dependent protease
LEPQAVYDFLNPLMMYFRQRLGAEFSARHPFHKPPSDSHDSKLGLRVASEHVTISHDLLDPDLGVVPFDTNGEPYASMTLIDRGILTALGYDRWYALRRLHEDKGSQFSGAFRLHGGQATMEDMIDGTARGLLVTRFSNVVMDRETTMAAGFTRDGVWLIEKGKVTKSVKNFRFVESPLFFLNNVEQLGTAVPIYTKNQPAVVPPIKARDFNMVALADAV